MRNGLSDWHQSKVINFSEFAKKRRPNGDMKMTLRSAKFASFNDPKLSQRDGCDRGDFSEGQRKSRRFRKAFSEPPRLIAQPAGVWAHLKTVPGRTSSASGPAWQIASRRR
jgi:hypothetical protein